MTSRTFSTTKRLGWVALLLLPCLSAQDRPIVSAETGAKVTAQRGSTVRLPLALKITPGYHINSSTPTDEYMIPLKLTWDHSIVFESGAPSYPKGTLEKYSFSDQPLSVYTGAVVIETPGKIAANTAPGTVTLTGKLRYQGCSDRLCYPPKTISVSVPVEIK